MASAKENTREIKKGNELLKDATVEVGFLDNAFKSLAASITAAFEEVVEGMDGASTTSEKIAKSYERDIVGAIKASTRGLEDQINLQTKINQGINVEKEIQDKLDKAQTRRKLTIEKINQANFLTQEQKKDLIEKAEDIFAAEEASLNKLKENNAEAQRQKSIFQLTGEAAGEIADKIDKSGTLSKILNGGLESVLTTARVLQLVVVGVFNALVGADKQVGVLAKDLGISYKEALKLQTALNDAAVSSGDVSLNTKVLGQALMDVNSELSAANFTIDDNLKLFAKLQKTTGLTAEELSGVNKLAIATGTSLEDNLKSTLGTLRTTEEQFGVAIKERDVLKEISKVSAATQLSLGRSTEEIGKAVVTAKALGLEFSKLEGIADGLLQFEQSIEKELEAELLLNKNINLEKARMFALDNNIAGVAEEIAKQFGTAEEFGKLNRIQQQALAEAVGMSREELAQSLFVQEQLKGLTSDEAALRKDQINKLQKEGLSNEEIKKKIGEQTLEDLKAQNSVQEELNKAGAKLNDLFMQLGLPLMNLVIPALDLIVATIEGLGFILSPIFDGFKALSTILGFNNEQLGIMDGILGTILFAAGSILTITKLTAFYEGMVTAYKNAQAVAEGGLLKKIIATTGALVVQLGIQLGILSASLATNAAVTFGVGVAIAVAAALAGIAAIKATMEPGNDVFMPGSNSGYGSRTILGPEGAIALNNKDSIIAGTDLFSNNQTSPANNTDMSRTNDLLKQVLNKPTPEPQIIMNDQELGTAVNMGAFSVQ